MAILLLPPAVDLAVRMAMTLSGWSIKYLHGYSVSSYHMTF
jgi:hypothetical protein